MTRGQRHEQFFPAYKRKARELPLCNQIRSSRAAYQKLAARFFGVSILKTWPSSADRALILGHAVWTNEHHYFVSDKRRLHEIREKMEKKGSPFRLP